MIKSGKSVTIGMKRNEIQKYTLETIKLNIPYISGPNGIVGHIYKNCKIKFILFKEHTTE